LGDYWIDSGECIKSTGLKQQTKSTISPPLNGGKCNPTRTTPCPVDCVLSKWSDYRECNRDYPGFKIRTRSIIYPPLNGGKQCDILLVESQKCEYPEINNRIPDSDINMLI
jgi:hypothetical protein